MYIHILFFIFCMLMLARKKIASGFFLFEAEQKAKNEKKKKRQEKLIQKAENKKSASCSNHGDTDVTDEDVFEYLVWTLLHLYVKLTCLNKSI